MANVRNANTFYINTAAADENPGTAGNLAVENIRVTYLILAGTGDNPNVVLRDVKTGAIKFNISGGLGTGVAQFDFSRKPVVFPNGINPHTITDVNVTVVIEESRG